MDPTTATATGLSNLATQGVLGTICVLLIGAIVYIYRSKEKQAEQDAKTLRDMSEKHAQQILDLQKNVQDNLHAYSDKAEERQKEHQEEILALSESYRAHLNEVQAARVEDAQAVTAQAHNMLREGRAMSDVLASAIDKINPPNQTQPRQKTKP